MKTLIVVHPTRDGKWAVSQMTPAERRQWSKNYRAWYKRKQKK